MSLQDPIADMLTRIRNANRVGRKAVLIPASKICRGIAKVLVDEGYIDGVEDVDDPRFPNQGALRLQLKYSLTRPVALRRPAPRVTAASPDLTAVVNIAMVILVVFMLTASFVDPQLYMQSRVALMEDGGVATLPPDWIPPTPLPILVNMDPQTPGDFTAIVGSQQVSDARTLQQILRQRHDAFLAAGTDVSEIQVEISPMSHVVWQHLITVNEAAQRAGFTNITFTPGR